MTMEAAAFELADIIQSRKVHRLAASPWRKGPVGKLAAIPEGDDVAVADNETVGHHPRFPQDPFTRCDIAGVEVGEHLEQGRGHHQLAHAARVETDIRAVLGVDRPRRVAEVQHGHGVAVGLFAQQVGDLAAERRVGWRQCKPGAGEPQVHLIQRQLPSRWLHPGAGLALLRQPVAFEPGDAGVGFAVQRVGQGKAGQQQAYQQQSAHYLSSCRLITRPVWVRSGASSSRRKRSRRASRLCR